MDVKFLFYSFLFFELGFLCKSDENLEKNEIDLLEKYDLKKKTQQNNFENILKIGNNFEKEININDLKKDIQLPEKTKNHIKRSKQSEKSKNKKGKNKNGKNKKGKKKKGKKRKQLRKGIKKALKKRKENKKKSNDRKQNYG